MFWSGGTIRNSGRITGIAEVDPPPGFTYLGYFGWPTIQTELARAAPWALFYSSRDMQVVESLLIAPTRRRGAKANRSRCLSPWEDLGTTWSVISALSLLVACAPHSRR